MAKPTINFDEEWNKVQGGIDKIVSFVDSGRRLNNGETSPLDASDIFDLYGIIYNLCVEKTSESYASELYIRYEAFFQNYVHTKILPAVREKSGELLLREVEKRWQDYNFIKRCLLCIFRYLDRYYVPRHGIPTLKNTAILVLKNLIYEEMKRPIIETVLSLINEDRKGNSVDRVLITEILEIVRGLGETRSKPYETDFEPAFIDSSCAY